MPRQAEGSGRILFAMDATASRAPSWDKAMQIQADMFETTSNLGALDVQLAWYRGYHEFHSSSWHHQGESLLHDMTAVHCMGGLTQIAKVLSHALSETKRLTSRHSKLNAVIFIGDCIEENPDLLCDLAGQLGILKVPIFVFHDISVPLNDTGAEHCFKQMAYLSGGAYCDFDQHSAAQLRDLLSAVAVYAVGGQKALADFSRKRGGLTRLLTQQIDR